MRRVVLAAAVFVGCAGDASTGDAVERAIADGTVCRGEADPSPDDLVLLDDDGTVLVAVRCITRPYNMSYELAWLDDDDLVPITVPTFDVVAGVVAEERYLLAAGLAPVVDGVLVAVAKGRGAGGCGDRATYRVDADAMTIELVQARSWECSVVAGDIADPDDWPVVYEAP